MLFFLCCCFVALLLVDAYPIHLAHRSLASAQRAKRSPHDEEMEAGVYVLQFKQRIDAVGLKRVAGVLGYEPRDYVPQNGLLIYINSSEQGLALQKAIDTRLARLEPLLSGDRQANIGATIHTMMSRKPVDRFVIYRNNSRGGAGGQRIKHDTPDDAMMVGLRVRVLGLNAEGAQGKSIELPKIEECVKTVSRTLPTAEYINDHEFVVRNVHCDDAPATADALVRRFPNVAWVEMRNQFKLFNRWSVPSLERKSASAVQRETDWMPLGTGKGQIVSISDTGVATSQCFFSDGLGSRVNGAVPRVSGYATVPTDTGNPKFRAYTSGEGGDFDDSNGHGTHTAGTIGGRAQVGSSSALFNGVAPDVRFCFFDLIGSNGGGMLAVPDDIGASIFTWSELCGAHIHSGSWGAEGDCEMTADEWSVDMYMWQHRTFLAVFAAGNTGPDKCTVGSPGRGKNVLTVGATMNGYDAIRMAVKNPPYAAAAYNISRVADFSSRGNYEFGAPAKVDVVANGGAYVWSAAFDGPKSGACDSTDDTVLGLEGTSMATPAVAGAAILVREWLVKNGGLETTPTGSLIRAMLIASALPTDGPFPSTKAYKTYFERRDAEGFGRVTLDQILNTNLRIISNERSELGLARPGDTMRVCLGIEGQSPLTTSGLPADLEMVIMLSYVDYPSAVGAKQVILVNDLDLVVKTAANGTALAVNGLPVGTKEIRSTNERVIVRPVRAVDISVVAKTVDFGGAQTFSLIVALRGPSASQYKMVISTPKVTHVETQAPCALCGSSQFLPRSDCIVCGDGVVSSPSEQCEQNLHGAECCDTKTCKWLPQNTLCATVVGACRVQGRCQRDSTQQDNSSMCVPSTSLAYTMKRGASNPDGSVNTLCDSTAKDAVIVPECAHSTTFWVDQLRNNASFHTSDDDRLCCMPYKAIVERRTPTDPLYHALALEYITTRLNGEEHITSDQLVAMRMAQLLLEKQCASIGLTAAADREQARTLIQALQRLSLPLCTNEPTSTTTTDKCTVSVRGTEVAEMLCNGPPNRYIDADNRCACGALYHAGEQDCRNLACSGNGASIYDYSVSAPRCICLPGWGGSQCQRCSEQFEGARYLCIGMPKSLTGGGITHVLQVVASSTAAARLDGTYYPSGVPKEPDAVPGTAPYDCACRVGEERIVPESFETHIEAVETSMYRIVDESVVWAYAQPILHPRTTAAAAAKQQKQTSNGQSRILSSNAPQERRMFVLLVPAIVALVFIK